ncbi:nucleotidyltransferase [Aphanothece hegewaldii CCALA 016]|uniref:Nucleotidyltransferase n=1 Tax=Aphanothece hegewaldii CCALA 016 TaxID=2107694 RepID=A0A2T1LTH6_9CHRO|nr:nucleotidyltransferase [Aphanothece hegewaldii]PSF33877.1 nucleotidyltransferase [Aphanothece hegewaldii CCALA 016]
MSVLSYLENLASLLNMAERESINIDRSINTLHTRLGNRFSTDQLKERFRFGSSVRRTMLPRNADPNSDVDYMVVFDNTLNYKPQTFMSYLKKFAEIYYSRSEIYQSSPTVVLVLGHIKFDLVPSYRNWNNLYIPAPRTHYNDWMITDPLSFNDTIEKVNKNTNFLFKPMIRLLKYWNASNSYIYESYTLEQKMTNTSFYFCHNLKDYLFSAIDSLNIWDLPSYQHQKVERAKQIIKNVRQYEQDGKSIFAELEIKKLFPELS